MVTQLRKSMPKNKIALITAIIIALVMMSCVTASWSSSPLDGILNSIFKPVEDFIQDVLTAVVAQIADPFSPQLDTIIALENGGSFAQNQLMTYDETTYRSSYFLNWTVTFMQRFGMIMATILILVFLLLCMVGRSEQIHDSPISLFVKYAIASFLIYNAWNVIFGIVNLTNDVWTQFVMAGVKDTTSGEMTVFNYATFKTVGIKNIFGFAEKVAAEVLWRLFFLIFGIFFLWKLFKSFLRLLLEVAERYFVFIMLLLMFPAVVPAIISNATISIFQAYVRMIISQTFLILTNGLFLKLFTFILVRGGWTGSLTGYILSFAYVRFCSRIDSYLLTIGMNAAQTGGGMLESLGGAMQTVTAAMRTGSQMGEMRHNLGVSTMNKALASGDKAGYERGVKMATPLTPFGKHAGQKIDSFEEAMQKNGGMPGDRIPDYSMRRQGEKFAVSEKGSMSSITAAAGQAGLSSNQTNAFVNRLESAGIKRDQIAGFKQVDGTKEYSSTAGKIQCAYDSNGNVLGYHSSSSGNDNFYVADTQKDEIDSYESTQQAEGYLSSKNEADVKAILGDEVLADSLIRSGNQDLGTQYYRYAKKNDTNVYEAEVSSASFHLDKANEKGYNMRANSSGRDFLVKERVVKNENDQRKS